MTPLYLPTQLYALATFISVPNVVSLLRIGHDWHTAWQASLRLRSDTVVCYAGRRHQREV